MERGERIRSQIPGFTRMSMTHSRELLASCPEIRGHAGQVMSYRNQAEHSMALIAALQGDRN